MRMLWPVITIDEDQEDGISYSVRCVNDQAWLWVVSYNSHALHVQPTLYRTCVVIELSFVFSKSFLRASKVSIAGIMQLEINDTNELLYFVSSERHKLLVSG